ASRMRRTAPWCSIASVSYAMACLLSWAQSRLAISCNTNINSIFSHNMDKSSGTAGAQSLRRALQLLRLLAEHHEDGIRLAEVMEASKLERSTVHRLLSCLV